MDRSSNDRISILFTESHEILPNSIYVMYEIRMNGGIKRELYTQIGICNKQNRYKWKGINKLHLDFMEFCIEYQNKSDSISTIIMIFQSDCIPEK